MKLSHLTQSALLKTKELWLKAAEDASHEVFLAEYEQIFDVIESGGSIGEIDGRMNVPIYYAVEDDSGAFTALVQLVQSKRGSAVWVKMTDLYMCPDIELNVDTEASTVARLKVFTAALLGVFGLTKRIANADTVKVYGRTEALVTFLRGMHTAFDAITSLGNMPGIQVTIEGRWLVFRTAS